MAGPVELLESATVGLAVGTAAADAFQPAIESARQGAWEKHPVKVLDPATMAELVAEGATDRATAYERAARSGFDHNKVDALIELALTAPGVSEGLTMLRRGFISEAQFAHFLRKAKFEPVWDAALLLLKDNVLPPPDLALGVIRGNLPVPEINGQPVVPLGGSTDGSTVPLDPVAGIDALKEGAMSGYDEERMATIIRNVGLPPGVIEGLRMLNRGIINEAAFYLLIAQSDARLSWGPFLLQLRREILTPHNYAELQLRGYIDQAARDAGAAMSGMEPADTQLLYDLLGRSIPVHQITTGLARGGVYDGPIDQIPEEFLASLQRGNLRPEYYNLAYANRYTYPSYFVLKPLTASGAITVDQCTTYLLGLGWPPELATLAAKSFVSTTTTTAASPAKGVTTKASNAVQKAYVQGNTTRTEAEAELTTLKLDPATFPQIFTALDVSRTAYLQGLSNVQVRNRYRNLGLTETEAVALLVDRGMAAADATTYLTATITNA